MISRRAATAVFASTIVASAGCLERLPSGLSGGEQTKEFPVEDLSVHNERTGAVEVTVSVTRNSDAVFEETFTLDSDATRTYEDVMANEREYEVTVRADGLTKTVTFDEHRDNAGLRFSIHRERIESVEVVH